MAAKAGDRIIVESERVGKPPREGGILEVIESPLGVATGSTGRTGTRARFDRLRAARALCLREQESRRRPPTTRASRTARDGVTWDQRPNQPTRSWS